MSQGGSRPGAGRKPKITELELIELLSPLDSFAFKALQKGVKEGDFRYIKLFMEYRYGKPKQDMEVKDEVSESYQIDYDKLSTQTLEEIADLSNYSIKKD